MKKLRICNCQINCHVGDIYGNVEKILSGIDVARENSADIVTFPELAISGYPPEDLLLKPSFISENIKALNKIANNSKDITAIVGFVSQDGCIYNSAAIINNCEIKGVYRKMFLPNYSVFDENRYFTKGDKPGLAFKLNGVTFAVNICEDIWYASGPLMKQALGAGAELIINISSSPFCAEKMKERENMLKARATDNLVMISYTNLVGGQDELVFDGGSMILDHNGDIIARAKRFEEDFLIADLDIEKVARKRLYSPQRKFEKDTPTIDKSDFETIDLICKSGHKSKKISMRIEEPEGEIEEIYNALCLGIKDYVGKNGFKKVVIGLSGGIDSALTAALAVGALGADSVIGVTMPSRYSSQETKSDAEIVAKNLGIKFITIPINNLFKEYLSSLQEVFRDKPADVTEENIQARIRGNILMALSNKFGCLVLSTGNKSELSVGYCTLYGDMAGGFSVLKDVYKTIVYKLADFINEKAGNELIPKSTIKREPTAELSPNQKDSDTLPPYDVLDGILNQYIELDLSVEEIVGKGFDKEQVKRVVKMVDINEYKRRQAAPGVKITQKAFGKDRRMPITNHAV